MRQPHPSEECHPIPRQQPTRMEFPVPFEHMLIESQSHQPCSAPMTPSESIDTSSVISSEPKSPVSGSMVSHMPLSDSAWIHGKKGFLENPRKFTRGKSPAKKRSMVLPSITTIRQQLKLYISADTHQHVSPQIQSRLSPASQGPSPSLSGIVLPRNVTDKVSTCILIDVCWM